MFNPYFKLESMFMKIAIPKKGSALEVENLTDDANRLELTFIKTIYQTQIFPLGEQNFSPLRKPKG
jgi:hypothetical protein